MQPKIGQFVASNRRKKRILIIMKQKDNECLRSYIKRFNTKRLKVEDCAPNMVIAAPSNEIQDRDPRKELVLHPLRSIDKLIGLAKHHMVAE